MHGMLTLWYVMLYRVSMLDLDPENEGWFV